MNAPRTSFRPVLIVLVLALAVATVGSLETDRVAEAQTAPVSTDDSLYDQVYADRWAVCGVSKAGYIRCWGSIIPLPVRSDSADFVQVAISRFFGCGRKTDGTVKCWSSRASTLPPQTKFDPDGTPGTGDERPWSFSEIQSGQHQLCGLTDNKNGQTAGKIVCWGPVGSTSDFAKRSSTVPDGTTDGTRSVFGPTPALFGADVDFTAMTFSRLASGDYGNCALIASGTDAHKPRCWSSTDSAGYVGDAEPDVPLSTIALGADFAACGIVRSDTTLDNGTPGDMSDDTTYSAGQVLCFGASSTGIVPDAPTTGTYSAVSVGRFHACAVTTAGAITCWGKGSNSQADPVPNFGQLEVPADLVGATFSGVYAGETFTCGLLDGQGSQVEGTLRCWGEQNYRTVFGTAWTPDRHSRAATVPYEERPRVPALAVDGNSMTVMRYASCALTAAGDAACWGHANYGWPLPTGVKGVASSFGSACYITRGGDDDGKVFCWGSNSFGMSSGSSTSSNAITADLDTLRFSRIYGGIFHYCGLIDDRDMSDGDDSGKVRCWGYNDQGQSVAPDQTAASRTITDLGTNTYTKLALGYRYSCGLLTTGGIVCWGNQSSPASTAHQVPAALQTKTFSDIDAGWWYQTCAIEAAGVGQTEGKLHCWGRDPTIGGETLSLATVPAAQSDLSFKSVSAGREHNCAVTTDGAAKCWGSNAEGRVAVPTRYEHTRFVEIDAGHFHTCGITDRGGAACWGADADPTTAGVQVARANGVLVNWGQADPQPPAAGGARVWLEPNPEDLTLRLGESYVFTMRIQGRVPHPQNLVQITTNVPTERTEGVLTYPHEGFDPCSEVDEDDHVIAVGDYTNGDGFTLVACRLGRTTIRLTKAVHPDDYKVRPIPWILYQWYNVTVVPALEPPIAPATLAAPYGARTSPGYRQITLFWNAVPGAVSYQYQERSSGRWVNTGSHVTSRIVTGLTNGQTYWFRVRAVDAQGRVGDATAWHAATPRAKPGNPAAMRAASGPRGGEITVSWRRMDEADSWRALVLPGSWETISPTRQGGRLTYTFTGLDAWEQYGVWLQGVNTSGAGPISSAVFAIPPPYAPANLRAEAGNRAVTLHWDKVAGARRYEYRQGSGNWTAVPGSYWDTTSHKFEGLTNGVRHAFQVRAVNDGGPGDPSVQVSATPVAPAQPLTVPGNFRVEDDFGGIAVSWDAVDGATGYQYRFSYRNPQEDGSAYDWPAGTTVGLGGTSDRVHNPGYPGQWLYFQVRAVRAPDAETTYSDWSETVPYWYQ